MAEHTPWPVTALIRDLGTDNEYVEEQVRCGCTDELENDYGAGGHE